jgi:hypothetical protein
VVSLARHIKRTRLPTGNNQQQVPYDLQGSVRNVFGQALPHVRLELSKPGGLGYLQAATSSRCIIDCGSIRDVFGGGAALYAKTQSDWNSANQEDSVTYRQQMADKTRGTT